MVSNRASCRAGFRLLPRGSGFLLGGVSAALVVLTVAGEPNAPGHAGKADGELRPHRLPKLELSLKAVPEARAQEVLG